MEHGVQALAIDELHGVVVDIFVYTHTEDRDDVGVVQQCGGPGLAAKAFRAWGSWQRARVQDLEGHEPPKLVVLGLVDDAHAAAAQLAQDLVPRQHERRGPFGQGRDRGVSQFDSRSGLTES